MSVIQPMFKHQSVQTENDSVEGVIELIEHYCDKLVDIINNSSGNVSIVLPAHIDRIHIIKNSIHELENHCKQHCEQGGLNIVS